MTITGACIVFWDYGLEQSLLGAERQWKAAVQSVRDNRAPVSYCLSALCHAPSREELDHRSPLEVRDFRRTSEAPRKGPCGHPHWPRAANRPEQAPRRGKVLLWRAWRGKCLEAERSCYLRGKFGKLMFSPLWEFQSQFCSTCDTRKKSSLSFNLSLKCSPFSCNVNFSK